MVATISKAVLESVLSQPQPVVVQRPKNTPKRPVKPLPVVVHIGDSTPIKFDPFSHWPTLTASWPRRQQENTVEPPRSVILIQGSDLDGHWYEAACDDEATVTYYLAQLAARQGHDLHHDRLGRFYRIGPHDYDLYTLELLDLAAVNRLRKNHETERI